MTRLLPLLAALASLWASAAAGEPRAWTIDVGASRLDVVYLINGEERRGFFGRFDGEAVFDPARLEEADLSFLVDMKSIDVGDPFGTVVVKTDDWFGAFSHPEGAFRLTSLSPKSGGGYVFVGDLTIKSITQRITGDLTLSIGEDRSVAKGRTKFQRTLFKIGVGLTSLFVEVGDEVAVEFEMVATPRSEE